MIVFVDVEWFQTDDLKGSITQMAACRVSEDWNVVEEFSCLVCPEDVRNCDWEHMAYNGYAPDEFMGGVSEAECLQKFAEFLREDDVLCVWAGGAKKILRERYHLYFGQTLTNRCVTVNSKVYDGARKRKLYVLEMYAVAQAAGIETPVPKHCAKNDIVVLRALVRDFQIDLNKKKKQIQQLSEEEKAAKKRARNEDILTRVPYHYVYTAQSHVFHRPTCKCMLGANEIYGSVFYETAAKRRRPCKLCKPVPVEKVGVRRTGTQVMPEYPGIEEAPQNPVVFARLLGDKRIQINKNKLVGCCHNIIHPGKLTEKIMKEHDCIGKQCAFFEKYEESSYWTAQEQKRREKDKRKAAQQKAKEEARRAEDELEQIKGKFQSYADECEGRMYIVRLQRESGNLYKIFYVSDNGFADGDRFPELLETIKSHFPKSRVILRHIRDLDGHFVTVDEYMAKKGR